MLINSRQYATLRIGLRPVLIDFYGLVEIGKCRQRISSHYSILSTTHIGIVIRGMHGYKPGKRAVGLGILFRLNLGNSLIEQHLLVLGGITQACRIIIYCTLIITGILPGYSPHLIGIYNKRIPLDRLGRIFLGPSEIFETQLGNRTIKIGVGQIGFYLYDPIEILYCQHIILEIKRIATDIGNAFGIELSRCLPYATRQQQQIEKQTLAHGFTHHLHRPAASCGKGCTNVHIFRQNN